MLFTKQKYKKKQNLASFTYISQCSTDKNVYHCMSVAILPTYSDNTCGFERYQTTTRVNSINKVLKTSLHMHVQRLLL